MEKYCKSCGSVFNNLKFKLCPYCGGELDTRYGRQPIPRKLRHEVFKRDGYRCRECGSSKDETSLEIDHIVPVAKGGTNDIDNLQTLCRECNQKKHTDEWVGGETDLEITQNELKVLNNLLTESNEKLSAASTDDEILDCEYNIIRLKESIEEVEKKITEIEEKERIAKKQRIEEEAKEKLFKKLYVKLNDEELTEVCDYFSLDYPSKEENLRYLANNYPERVITIKIESIESIKKIKKFNTTTDSIYDLGDLKVLIITYDGKNITNWNEVYTDDILLINENLSDKTDLSKKYEEFMYLEIIVASGVTKDIKDLSFMFCNCESLFDISALSDWDVSNVKDMNGMFLGCITLFDISALSSWDVSNVEDMSEMFWYCPTLFDISALSSWDVSNVKYLSSMFVSCESLFDISALSSWDVSNVEDMSEMFMDCLTLFDISALSSWDVSNVKDMSRMFNNCPELVDASPLSSWNISENVCIDGIFDDCPKLEKYPSWYKETN